MLNTRDLFRQFYPGGRRTLYVSGSGSDTNSGLESTSAKRTIQSAIEVAREGDRIVVGEGIYGYTQFYGLHGSANAWVTVENTPGKTAIVDVSRPTDANDSRTMTDGLDIQESSYVAIFGLEIRGSQRSEDANPSGIAIFRNASHIAIWQCHVHDFPGGGVNCFYSAPSAYGAQALPGGGWDLVDVFFNTVHATSKYSPYNTSGISFYGAQDLTGTTIDGHYGYRAVGNYIYDVICTVPYSPGGVDFVTDGNGISSDSLAIPNSLNPALAPYLKRGLIEGNVIAACGGRGVHIYNSKNVDVVNNTLIGNLRTASPAISGSTEADLQLDVGDAENSVCIANNLIAPMNTPNAFDRGAQTVIGNTAVGGTDTVPAGNQSLRAAGLGVFAQTPTPSALAAGCSLAAFSPRIVTSVPRVSASLGFQVLGMGKQTGASVTVGAVPGR